MTTGRNRALVFLGMLVIGASGASMGCELLVDFDRSLIDAGVTEPDAQTETDGSVDGPPPADIGHRFSAEPSPTAAPTLWTRSPMAPSPTRGRRTAATPSTGADAGDAGCSASSDCPGGRGVQHRRPASARRRAAATPAVQRRLLQRHDVRQAQRPRAPADTGGRNLRALRGRRRGRRCVHRERRYGNLRVQRGRPTARRTRRATPTTHQCTTTCSRDAACNGGCCGGSGRRRRRNLHER